MNPWLIVLWTTVIIVSIIILALGALAIYGVYSSIVQERIKLQRMKATTSQPILKRVPDGRNDSRTHN